jgi:hypothetical protein
MQLSVLISPFVSGSAGLRPAAVGVSPTAFSFLKELGETPNSATETVALPETASP